jgi:hypothetical protein
LIEQRDLALECLRHHKLKNMSWVLHTDTDEFLTYNFIKQDEDPSVYDERKTYGAKTKSEINKERKRVLPIRQSLPSFRNSTILSFIKHKEKMDRTLHHRTRMVGLFFGSKPISAKDADEALLMAPSFVFPELNIHGRMSKVMLDVSRIEYCQIAPSSWNTIHNPLRRVCGWNGRSGNGKDYQTAVFRFNHYLGPLNTFLDRKSDSRTNDQVKRYEEKEQKSAPYSNTSDDSMNSWVSIFKDRVGPDMTNFLLFDLLRRANNNAVVEDTSE